MSDNGLGLALGVESPPPLPLVQQHRIVIWLDPGDGIQAHVVCEVPDEVESRCHYPGSLGSRTGANGCWMTDYLNDEGVLHTFECFDGAADTPARDGAITLEWDSRGEAVLWRYKSDVGT
jgi:hypothetical protein